MSGRVGGSSGSFSKEVSKKEISHVELGQSEEFDNLEYLMKEHDNNTSISIPITLIETSDQPVAAHTNIQPQGQMTGQNLTYQLCPPVPVPVQNINIPLSPLQLVYLQPAPFGFNIIPVQPAAATYPAYPPFSPLGFPTFQQFPQPHPVAHGDMTQTYHNSQVGNIPYLYPAPGYINPMYTNQNPFPMYNYGTSIPEPDSQDKSIVGSEVNCRPKPKLFRPWEDIVSPDTRGTEKSCELEAGGENQKCEENEAFEKEQRASNEELTGQATFSETDFPALNKELSNMKLRN